MLRWLTAGESHGPALVAILEGLPAHVEVTSGDIADALARRRLGYGRGALLRRVERAAALAAERPAARRVGAIEIDPGTRRTTVAGEPVHLTPTEFDLLLCLAREAGQVLSRERLLREVWDWGDAWGNPSAARTVDSHVKALRAKVGAARIRTVHGVGYALEDVQ